MEEDAAVIGTPITLAELKALGEFVRWQDVEARLAELPPSESPSGAYPLIPTRLPANETIDLFSDGCWRQVNYLRTEGTPMGGDHRIVYLADGKEQGTPYNWYKVAPAGWFTDWQEEPPEDLTGAELLDRYKLAQHNHRIHSQKLESVDWPYLTFQVASFDPDARWVEPENMWNADYRVHAADPRVKVEGVVPREPWFNTTISVSHRWLSTEHPDPDGVQYEELLKFAEQLGLHDCQAFLIDYCSLPQHPRSEGETAWFDENLPGFQKQFKYVTLVLNSGSADYATRAWCMFELMLAAMSRTPRPTLLNHDLLDEPLSQAVKLAKKYLEESVWNQQQIASAFSGGLNMASYSQWTRDPMNVALYNAALKGRRAILEKFEKELGVTDPNDREVIAELFTELVFKQ